MITLIYNNGVSLHENKLQLDPLETLESLSMQFDTVEARDIFVSQFPKSLKIQSGFISEYTDKLLQHPYVRAYKMGTTNRNCTENKVTGTSNEAGDKRMKRFYEAVKVELAKQG